MRRRPVCDLYHSALQVRVPEGTYVIEQAPVQDWSGGQRGVVAEGPVGTRWAGRFRIFRYEIRRWHNGRIPDATEAVDSPRRLTEDPSRARRVLDVVEQIPTPIWGRDEFGTGEMWNSNSVIAWVIARSGIDTASILPPEGGPGTGLASRAHRRELARHGILPTMTDQFLEMAQNLARYHREHEKFYARAPLEEAVALLRTSAALRALAERWSTVEPHQPETASPFSGAEDLNDERAIELAGILFMEGEGGPAEISRIKRELASTAEDNAEASDWLGQAMETSWAVAETLLDYPQFADLLAERHRIISNDWQAASLARLVALNLQRAGAVLERLDFSPASVRADLDGPRDYSRFLHSTCELIDHAADLAARSGSLVHENERRWRIFKDRIEELERSEIRQ